MPYTITSTHFDFVSDSTDGNGVRWVQFRIRQVWTNSVAPFDSYEEIPSTAGFFASPALNLAWSPLRKQGEPYTSLTTGTHNNPLTLRSASIGVVRITGTGVTAGPTFYDITVTSTGPYTLEPTDIPMYSTSNLSDTSIYSESLIDSDVEEDSATFNDGLN